MRKQYDFSNARKSPCVAPIKKQIAAGMSDNSVIHLTVKEAVMDKSLVSRDPEIMSGALCFTGTRVLVKNLFDYLEGASSLEDFLEDFPSVSRAKAVAVLEAARESLAADALAA